MNFKKRILIFILSILAVFAVFGFTACSCQQSPPIDTDIAETKNTQFVLVEEMAIETPSNYNIRIYVCYDKDTKVMYMITYAAESGLSVTVMEDEDGKPKIYSNKY